MKNHPLFPVPEGVDDADDKRDIKWIHVYRNEKGVEYLCPTRFTAEELTDPGQLHELFGGGSYQLVGRDDTKIRARSQRMIMPGPSKPLVAESPPPPAPPAAAPAFGMPMPGGPGGFNFLEWFMMQQQQAQQQQQRQADAQAAAAAAQQASTTSIIVALIGAMGGNKSDPALAEMVKASAAQNAAIISTMATLARPPSTPFGDLREAVQLGKDMATPPASTEKGDVVDTAIDAFMGGMGMGVTAASGGGSAPAHG